MSIPMNSALQNWTQERRLSPVTPSLASVSLKRSLPEVIRNIRSADIAYGDAIRQFQERYIMYILAKHRGHLGKTAIELGMHRNTLSRTLTELNLEIAKIRADMRRSVDADRRRLRGVASVRSITRPSAYSRPGCNA